MYKCQYCEVSSPTLSWDRATADEFLGETYTMDMISSITKQEPDTIHICPNCKADTII
ncbi:hypothetical protein SHANETTE_13 [Bacillus phage Shanette]|uniref:Uncharacterized protein n=1 Tax=Bacillus phage Shanette TaxID=1296656 RepID=S5MTJ8_9CAUD|nr:hypothetical protein AVV46_gp013 [Bacillus phage Shanette]AGR47122.1 hypothetical protein SHANETTE_13 [Bacillus phage Shanette]